MTKHLDLAGRLNLAAAKGKGTMLRPDEVAELVQNLQGLSAIYIALNQHAVKVTIPAIAIADAILDTLCWDESFPAIAFDKSEKGWSIWRTLDQPFGPAESFAIAIDLWRNLNGKDAAQGIEVIIPGSQVVNEVQASLMGS